LLAFWRKRRFRGIGNASKLDQKPDELVIDWGNVPSGSVAQVYLPGTTSAAILAWAGKLYTTHNLTAADPHTIQVNAGGTTYIPIPQGGTINLTGLLSVQLPAGVKKGDEYEIVVRQITRDDYTTQVIQLRNQSRKAPAVKAVAPQPQYAWRHTIGIFKIPSASRWFPVFERYLKQVAGRVTGLGGNPILILPSGNRYPAGGREVARTML
jgi:hypothetical protein